jgi:transcriptional regulator with XRE-family HTH domain
MKTTLLEQIRRRRQALGAKIQDMPLLAGLTRQQYGKIEAGGNPRLSTLDQIAEGLGCSLLLVPKSMLHKVELVLTSDDVSDPDKVRKVLAEADNDRLDENPWGDL